MLICEAFSSSLRKLGSLSRIRVYQLFYRAFYTINLTLRLSAFGKRRARLYFQFLHIFCMLSSPARASIRVIKRNESFSPLELLACIYTSSIILKRIFPRWREKSVIPRARRPLTITQWITVRRSSSCCCYSRTPRETHICAQIIILYIYTWVISILSFEPSSARNPLGHSLYRRAWRDDYIQPHVLYLYTRQCAHPQSAAYNCGGPSLSLTLQSLFFARAGVKCRGVEYSRFGREGFFFGASIYEGDARSVSWSVLLLKGRQARRCCCCCFPSSERGVRKKLLPAGKLHFFPLQLSVCLCELGALLGLFLVFVVGSFGFSFFVGVLY